MKLADIINGNQIVSLVHESDTELSLALLDPANGESLRLDIKADMVTKSDEALLFVEAQGLEVSARSIVDQVDLGEWWARGDMATEVQQHLILTPDNCPCDRQSDCPCNICDGGLAICSLCGKAEIELDGLCLPFNSSEPEPPPTWTVTPDGREFDLRAREGGLF